MKMPKTGKRDNFADRQRITPMQFQRTRRDNRVDVLTSTVAGRVTPIAFVPLLREDSAAGSVRFELDMMETADLLMNGVEYRIQAWCVPKLAFDRFQGMDDLNRSYTGQNAIPWFETTNSQGAAPILLRAGEHWNSADPTINTDFIEAYNQVWNYRARNRAVSIAQRARLDTTLAPAFIEHRQFGHVVPSFDQAFIDGQVPLVTTGQTRAPVKGLGVNPSFNTPAATAVRETNAPIGNQAGGPAGGIAYPSATATSVASAISVKLLSRTEVGGGNVWVPEIYAELANAGITMSLSNIELAKKTQAFAKMRAEYEGYNVTDDYIVDLLMAGLQVPEQNLRQPFLLAEASGIFGMAQRYATDAVNLTQNVVNGSAMANLNIRCPVISTSGVILITIEYMPEQLYERAENPYLVARSVSELPDALRDTLNPQQVDVLRNREVDVLHATPNGVFGYVPMNHKWNMTGVKVGGKFRRPVGDAFTEARQRIWTNEAINPTLNSDFYLTNTLHQKVFEVTTGDTLDIVARGLLMIDGLTQFGPPLIEGTGAYQEVADENTTPLVVQ